MQLITSAVVLKESGVTLLFFGMMKYSKILPQLPQK